MRKHTRREFVKIVGLSGSGLLLAAYVPASILNAKPDGEPKIFSPSVYLQIDSNGVVTVFVHRTEMGQGVQTSLPMLVAEELEVEVDKIRVVQANADAKYGSQSTGGSWSIRSTFEPFRIAGATARMMLISAAALKFGVDESKCFAENGYIKNTVNSKSFSYAELVDDAAKLTVPKDVKLKDPKDYKIIGKRVPRTDTPDKLFGKAKFGIDIALPGMFFAVIMRPPVYGATLKNFDDSKTKKVNGVVEVIKISRGIAVIAKSTWSAIKGRDALVVDWDLGSNVNVSSDSIKKEMESHISSDGFTLEEYGNPFSGNSKDAKVIEAIYEVPYIAHAPMEPVNAVANITKDKAEMWVSSQNPQDAQNRVAQLLNRKPEDIVLHVTLVGGAFGRKLRSDFAVEAAEISNVSGKIIKLMWTRDDDMKYGYFRPTSMHSMKGIVAENKVMEFKHHIIATSIRAQDQGMPKTARDYDIAGSATGWKYKFPYNKVSGTVVNTPVLISWLRAVYGTQNPFAIESFIDELAVAAEKDPLELRKELLVEDSRLKNVMLIAAEKAEWNKKLEKGKGRGIAIYEGYNSFCALVAEVTVNGSKLSVDKYVAVIDCGIVVNPDTLESQIEGSIAFALSAALKQKITIKNGAIEQSNYDDFPLLTLSEMPKVEVHIIPSVEKVGGIGELAIAPTAPALCNAIYNSTGKRIRKLPIELN